MRRWRRRMERRRCREGIGAGAGLDVGLVACAVLRIFAKSEVALIAFFEMDERDDIFFVRIVRSVIDLRDGFVGFIDERCGGLEGCDFL